MAKKNERGEFDNCMPKGCSYTKRENGIRVYFYYTIEKPKGETVRKQKSKVFETADLGKRELKAAIAQWHLSKQSDIEREQERESMTHYERDAEKARSMCICEFIENDIDMREVNGSIEANTIKTYRSSLKHIRSYFDGVALEDVTNDDVKKWESSLSAKGFSVSTVTKAHRLLKYALNNAVEAGYINRNPMNGIKPPKRKRKEPSAMDEAEKDRLLAAMRAHGLDWCMMGGYIALFTGMRCGEVCGLRWRDITLDRDQNGHLCGGWIRVLYSIGGKKKGASPETRIKATKTDDPRDIPVSKELGAVLEVWRKEKAQECLAAGVSLKDTFVTGGAAGYIITERQSRQWSKFVRDHDIKCTDGAPAKMHPLRHTFATLAIKHGMDVKTLSSILGHADAAMTLNIYASADPSAKRQAAGIIDKMITGDRAELVYFPKTGTDN